MKTSYKFLFLNFLLLGLVLGSSGRAAWAQCGAGALATPTYITPANATNIPLGGSYPIYFQIGNTASTANVWRIQIAKAGVTWTAANGFTTSINPTIDVPINKVTSFTTIGASTPPAFALQRCSLPAGTYQWTARVGSDCGHSNYTSPRTFTIAAETCGTLPPSVHQVYPIGGETFTAGTSVTVKWYSSNANYAYLTYFDGSTHHWLNTSSGSTYQGIPSPNGLNSYTWNIPNGLNSNNLRFFVIVSTANLFTGVNSSNRDYDYSEYFSVQPPVSTTGSVKVNITPTGAVSAGAQWRLDGGAWQNSGATLTNIATGNHIISFKTVAGYNTPPNININVTAGGTVNEIGNYTILATPTYTVSGKITEDGVGLAGVSIGGTTTDASGNYSITVNSGASLTLTPNNAGYTFSPNSQTFNNITSNQVQDFTALPLPPSLLVSSLNINSAFGGDNQLITVTSNVNWTVSTTTSWITLSTNNGTNNGTFSIQTSANNGLQRTGTVIISGSGLTKTIQVTQEGVPLVIVDAIDASVYPNSIASQTLAYNSPQKISFGIQNASNSSISYAVKLYIINTATSQVNLVWGDIVSLAAGASKTLVLGSSCTALTKSPVGNYRLELRYGVDLNTLTTSSPLVPTVAGNNPQAITIQNMVNLTCVSNPNQVMMPIINPTGGVFNKAQIISMSAPTAGSTIRYTIDGTSPTASSPIYVAPISVNTNTTIKAKAFMSGMLDSETNTQVFNIHPFVASGRYNADPCEIYRRFGDMQQDILENGNASHNLSPAEIIYYSSKENGINPVLILAKLQDEQSLIEQGEGTDLIAFERRLLRATGMGAFDRGDKKSWYGFYPQVVACSYQFNKYRGQGKKFKQAYEAYTTGTNKYNNFVTKIYPKYASAMNAIAGKSYLTTNAEMGYFNDFQDITIAHIQTFLNAYNGALKNTSLFAGNSKGNIDPCSESFTSTVINPTLETDKQSVDLESNGNGVSVSVISNTSWNATGIGVSVQTDYANNKIVITKPANSTGTNKTGSVILKTNDGAVTKTILVQQTGRVNPTKLIFPASGGSKIVNNNTLTLWSLAGHRADWIKTDNFNIKQFTVTVPPYTGTSPRTDKIVVNIAGGGNETIQVVQLAVVTSCTGCNELKGTFMPRNGEEYVATATHFRWENELGRGITKYIWEIKETDGSPVTTIDGVENIKEIVLTNPNQALVEYTIPRSGWLQNGKTYIWKVSAYVGTTLLACKENSFTVFTLPEQIERGRNRLPNGRPLGSFENVVIFKNGTLGTGNADYAGWRRSTPYTANPDGWQCAELALRYARQRYGIGNRKSGAGHAKSYFKLINFRRGFAQYANGESEPPMSGDIISFDGTDVGHVAIVKNVVPDPNKAPYQTTYDVYIAQQNLGDKEPVVDRHVNMKLTMARSSNGKYTVNANAIWSRYKVLGWIRPLPKIHSPGQIDGIPTLTDQNVEFKFDQILGNKYTVYLSKLNPATNCYELQNTWTTIPTSPVTLPAGTYKWRLKVDLPEGSFSAPAYYFQIASSTNSTFTAQNFYKGNISVNSLGSVLSNSQVSRKLGDTWVENSTDASGNLRILSYDALSVGDSLKIEAHGYVPIALALDQISLNQKALYVPMVKTNAANLITNPTIEWVNKEIVTSSPTAPLRVKANNLDRYEIYTYQGKSVDRWDTQLSHDSIYQVELDTGLNYINLKLYNANYTDSMIVTRQIYYIPVGMPDSLTYNVTINNPKKYRGKIYLDDIFVKETNQNEVIKVHYGSHEIRFSAFGYVDTAFVVTKDQSTINLNLKARENYNHTANINFANNAVQYGAAGVTLENKSRSPITLKRSFVSFASKGVKNLSDLVEITKSNVDSLGVYIALNQTKDLAKDSIYLLDIRGDNYLKIMPNAYLKYDSLTQKLSYKNVFTTSVSLVLAQRQAPIKKDNLHYTIYKGSTLRLPVTAVFSDPDSIKKDMQMFLKVPNPNFEVVQTSPDTIEIKRCLTGEHTLYFAATHDGYEVVNKVKITVIPLLTKQKNVSCKGEGNGEASVVPQQGTAPIGYEWSNGEKARVIRNLKKGTYKVKVLFKDCYDTASVVITEPDSLLLSAQVRHLTKQQSNDGKINLIPKGGTPFSDGKYKYTWLFPDGSKKTTEDLDSLTSGKYEVVVTDSMGCSAKLVVLIKEPDLLSVSKNIREISCKGAKDGAIELKIHGGVPPYKVFINTQKDTINVTSTSPIVKFSGLDWNNAEPYEILVKDENNTAITVQITLKEPEESPKLSISKTDFCISDANPTVIVKGLRNGKFVASPAGLVINDSTGIIDIKASRAGSYIISYQSSNATCVANTLKVNVFSYPFKNGFTKMYACGSLTLDAKNEGCTYEWSTKETTRQITVTESGIYKVKINNGTCTVEDEVQVIISKPIITFSKQNVTVFGGNNGSIKIGITGTVGTPTITWADEATKNLLERVNLKAGTYTVSIQDSIGCTASAKIVIEQPAPFKVSLELTHAQGCKEDNGSAAALATGGTPPYTYLWNNGKTTPSIDKLGFGFVSVTVTDANKVTAKAEGYILQADSIIAQMKVQEVSCGLATDGLVTLQVSGGKAPYSIEGSNGFKTTLSKPSEIKITGLAPTQSVPYQIIIRDGQGCVKYLNTMIKVSAMPTLTFVKGDTVCKGTPAKLTVRYSGKIFPYSFTYSDGKSTQVIRNVEDSIYTFQVNSEKDAVYTLVSVSFGADCKGSTEGKSSVKVNDLPELLNVQVSNENCDNKDAIILISHKEIKNGKAPFEVSIDGGKTFANREKFDSLKAGKYTLIIRDANSCKYEYKQSIEIINSPTACLITRIPNMITPNCDGINDAFEIPELRFYPNCVVAIYDRTGREVFRSEKGYLTPWNPCRDGGNIADLTTYYYQIDLGTGKHQAIRGFIDIKK